MVNSLKKTVVYVDSFNLYYGILKRRQPGFKWLNLEDWLKKLLPPSQYTIQRIKFFTARVSATTHDPQKPVRQDIYFRALKTLPTIEIIEGTFLFKWTKIQVTPHVQIDAKVAEEKGTDVNIAAHIINDGHKKLFDTAVLVTNDSDLAEVVKIVTQELRLEVGIINPCQKYGFSKQLNRYVTFKKRARDNQILHSQFPASLTDKIGSFTRPLTW